MPLTGRGCVRPIACSREQRRISPELDLMTIEAEDIRASRVFKEGAVDLDGDEGANALVSAG